MPKRSFSSMSRLRLRRWKEDRRLSVPAMAAELGMRRTSVADYLAGRRPIPLSVARLCWTLDCIDPLQHRLTRSQSRLARLQTASQVEQASRDRDMAALEQIGAQIERTVSPAAHTVERAAS